jgi:transcriptional regulator with XRE-family HTH domain
LLSVPAPARFAAVDQFAYVGETLRRLRKEKGKTLEQLGEEAGLGRGQLSRIENQRQEATLKTLSKILNSEGISRREFFRRYELVESEAQANVRAKATEAEAPGDSALASQWPEEIQAVLTKVESFVQMNFSQPKPIAQGAVEIGDMVVLFRVMPKNAPGAQVAEIEAPPPKRKRKIKSPG